MVDDAAQLANHYSWWSFYVMLVVMMVNGNMMVNDLCHHGS